MSLCREDVVEKLNSQFIPCFVDTVWKIGAPFYQQPRALAALRARLPGGGQGLAGVSAYIVALDGTVTDGGNMMTASDPSNLVADLLERCHTETKGSKIAEFHTRAATDGGPYGLQIRVVGRYARKPSAADLSQLDTYGAVMPSFLYPPALQAPMLDWVVLTRDEWPALLPPPAEGGAAPTYVLDPELATRIFRHFTAASSPLDANQVTIKSAAMRGEVVSTNDARTTVLLEADVSMNNVGRHGTPGTGPLLTNVLVEHIVGVLEFDTATRHITDLQFATTSALDCTDKGFKMPFSVVAYTVAR